MSSEAELLGRLDRIQATLRLAFAPQLAAARDTIRADEVSAAILDLASDWVGSTELQEKVAKKTKKGTRVVRDRFPGLVDSGVLEARGTERRMEYRNTGLI